MRKFRAILTATAVAGLLIASAVTPSDAARRHAHVRHRGGGFDGIWSVVISTAFGSCGTYRASVQIAGGRVESAGGDFDVSGSVSGSGATAVRVSSSVGSASGYGRLRGSYGSGRWRSSGGECAGSWSASRRG